MGELFLKRLKNFRTGINVSTDHYLSSQDENIFAWMQRNSDFHSTVLYVRADQPYNNCGKRKVTEDQ